MSHIKIKKNPPFYPHGGQVNYDPSAFYNMWAGQCFFLGCTSHSWQYWSFGATLGHGLEHIRRHYV